MSESGKSIHNKIDYYRIYADQEAETTFRKMREVEEEARGYAGRVFKDPDAVSVMFYLSGEQLEPAHKLLEHADRLVDKPSDFGRLKGLSFLPKNMAEMKPHLEKLRGCLQEHIDLVAVRKTYRDLHQEAINATRLPPSRQEEALRQLQQNRDYSDTVRDTREQNALERRRQSA